MRRSVRSASFLTVAKLQLLPPTQLSYRVQLLPSQIKSSVIVYYVLRKRPAPLPVGFTSQQYDIHLDTPHQLPQSYDFRGNYKL